MSSRCYSERRDYDLEELGDDAWLTGCPLCGSICWDLPEETRKEIDDELDRINEEEENEESTNIIEEYENEYE